jgi:hypothetical protein
LPLPICIAVKLGLAATRVVVVMIRTGKPGSRMFARRMFVGSRVSGVHGARMGGTVIGQSGAVTRHCCAARTGCRSVTAQAATPGVAAAAARVSPAATATAAAAGVSSATTTATRVSAATA